MSFVLSVANKPCMMSVILKNVIMLSVVMLYVVAPDTQHNDIGIILSVIMPIVIMLRVAFSYCYVECHYAGCRSAECHYAECHYAECRGTPVIRHSTQRLFVHRYESRVLHFR
jgi:hypothetical protein